MNNTDIEGLAFFLGSHAIGSLIASLAIAFCTVALSVWIFRTAERPISKFVSFFIPFGRLWDSSVNATAGGYLGVHLALGLGIAFLLMHTFGELAEGIVGGSSLSHFDSMLAETLHVNATPPKLILFRAISFLANLWTLGALALVGLGVLMHRKRFFGAAAWLIALTGGGLLNIWLKDAFQRLRPSFPNSFVSEHGWSFPSGHAMGSVIVYGMAAYLINRELKARRAKLWVIATAIALVVFIGFSRLYLTVHYFSDVVAGYAAGGFWLLVCITGLELAKRIRNSRSTIGTI